MSKVIRDCLIFVLLCDWSRKLALLFEPIRFTTKIYCIVCMFLLWVLIGSSWYFPCYDWLLWLLWFYDTIENVLKILTLSSYYLKMVCYREHDGEYCGLCVQSVLPTSCISNVDSIVIINRSRKMVVFELRSRRKKNLYVLSKGRVKSKILSLQEESNLIYSDFALRCSSTKPQRLRDG